MQFRFGETTVFIPKLCDGSFHLKAALFATEQYGNWYKDDLVCYDVSDTSTGIATIQLEVNWEESILIAYGFNGEPLWQIDTTTSKIRDCVRLMIEAIDRIDRIDRIEDPCDTLYCDWLDGNAVEEYLVAFRNNHAVQCVRNGSVGYERH